MSLTLTNFNDPTGTPASRLTVEDESTNITGWLLEGEVYDDGGN